MSKRIFVTATNTDIGKTYTTKLLLTHYASLGYRVGVIKPVETGVVDNKCPDGDELLSLVKQLNAEFKNITTRDIVPIQYELPAAPYVASNAKVFDFKKVDESVEKLEKLCDILIFEGAGGLLVPIDEKHMLIDLIPLYKAKALLVTHCSLGCINDTLLSKKALDSLGIDNCIAFNCRDNEDNFSKVSEPYFVNTNFELFKVKRDIDKICDVLYNL